MIGTIIALPLIAMSWQEAATLGNGLPLLGLWLLMCLVFALTAFSEKLRQKRLQRLGVWSPATGDSAGP
ncbi:hypothetical protein ACFQLX_21250 [Streptomyces polyrhachis]|uniref:Uncharacterized protein n=1 Tax=Streptomyces polyrhachis TaxID=1282885 RepID=A0ABW2GMG1_9ACTN